MSIKQKSFVIVDVETTGLSPFRHRVIEFGAIKVVDGQIVEEFEALMQSVEQVPSFITRLTGITTEMLFERGELPEDLLPRFREFVGDVPFVAHNAHFDYNFCNAEFGRYLIPKMNNRKICTAQIARRKIPELPNHKLTTIKDHFKVDYTSHRALTDAYVCLEIMKR